MVTDAAKRISAGSYGIQIENKYTDEMGELVDNINDMSLKIGQNEKMKSEFISSVSHELAHAPDGHQRLGRDHPGGPHR